MSQEYRRHGMSPVLFVPGKSFRYLSEVVYESSSSKYTALLAYGWGVFQRYYDEFS
jgi:hypothetical protein